MFGSTYGINLFCYIVHHSLEHAPDHLTMNPVSHHALLTVGRVRLGCIDGDRFILAVTAFQEEKRYVDQVANRLHAFTE